LRERPYQHDSTASRLLSEVKHVRAWLVLRWGTTLESQVLFSFADFEKVHVEWGTYCTVVRTSDILWAVEIGLIGLHFLGNSRACFFFKPQLELTNFRYKYLLRCGMLMPTNTTLFGACFRAYLLFQWKQLALQKVSA
jgi:hypothetical protein